MSLHFIRNLCCTTLILSSVMTLPAVSFATSDSTMTTSSTPATLSSPAAATDLFPDLPVGSEYYVGVKYLKDLGLIHGYPDGTFKPLQQINRAEALKILVGAIKFDSLDPAEKPLVTNESSLEMATTTESGRCPFPDLDVQAWYFPYVCEAYQNKVISGYPDGTFKPEQTINRVEALKIDLLQSGISTQTTYTDNFDDVSPADWFWNYAQIADEKSLIVADRNGDLHPSETMNRGDFAMLVYRTLRAIKNNSEFGRATYYGGRFEGQNTATGEIFQAGLLTAAHKTLPFNTIVRVTNLSNGKQVDVRINDRGPYVNGTIIDLSTSAFEQISKLSTGVFQSEVEIIQPVQP